MNCLINKLSDSRKFINKKEIIYDNIKSVKNDLKKSNEIIEK